MPDPNLPHALLQLAEEMKPLQEFLDGQKEDWLRRGYSSVAADKMVVELYTHLLWMVRGGKS